MKTFNDPEWCCQKALTFSEAWMSSSWLRLRTNWLWFSGQPRFSTRTAIGGEEGRVAAGRMWQQLSWQLDKDVTSKVVRATMKYKIIIREVSLVYGAWNILPDFATFWPGGAKGRGSREAGRERECSWVFGSHLVKKEKVEILRSLRVLSEKFMYWKGHDNERH